MTLTGHIQPTNNFCPTLWQVFRKTMTSLSHALRSVSGGSVKCFTLSQRLMAKQGPIRAWRLWIHRGLETQVICGVKGLNCFPQQILYHAQFTIYKSVSAFKVQQSAKNLLEQSNDLRTDTVFIHYWLLKCWSFWNDNKKSIIYNAGCIKQACCLDKCHTVES